MAQQRARGKQAATAADAIERRRRRLLWPTLLLLAVGLASSIYLFNLHLEVHGPGGAQVQSFCAINKTFNCVTVATSEYSIFLGIPVALYGVEFFGLAALATLLSGLGLWRVRAWDSLVFVAVTLSLPVCALLAYISVSCISSVCIVCTVMYAVSVLTFLVLGVANRSRLGWLLIEGPRELLRSLGTAGSGAGLLLVLALGLSQFLWIPRLIHAESRPQERGHEIWRSQPVSGATIGPKDAPVTIEEFTDFECPYCGQAHQVMIRLLGRFPGKIHLVHRDYPLDHTCNPTLKAPFHKNACSAAIWARCAARQDRYWPYEARLFSNRERLEPEHLREYAREAGLDLAALAACVASPGTRQAVIADIRAGMARKMDGTPTFYINGEMVVGMRTLEFWEEKVASLLRVRR